MVEMSYSKGEIEQIINELTSLKIKWNLKLNKRKSEILTSEQLEEVNGIKCSTTVKYLGVKVAVERKDQIRISKEQINKNV